VERQRFRDYEHLFRVAGLFIAGAVVFFLIRGLLVPPTFGAYGHYRAAALEEKRQRPVVYAGQSACVECHDDVGKLKASGPHAHISCETCHGALGTHAGDPEALKPVLPNAATLCLTCHRANVAKPAHFPQIDPKDHPDDTCTSCHKPHQPKVD
jgi:hypothetical protein